MMARPRLPQVGLALAFAVTLAQAASAQEGAGSLRPAARLLGAVDALTAPGSIDTLERVELGGIPQWISVRGLDRQNPVLLYLHGGPGFPAMPASHRWQGPWEEYFTVVQWDQRGAGKSYPGTTAESMTVQQFQSDTHELVLHLRRRFQRERLFLLGHSWGA